MDSSHRRAITLLSAAAFASAASLRVCDALLPVVAREFHTTVGQAAHIISSFSIAYRVMQIVYGPLGDRYGKFRLVAYATLACMIGGIGVIIAQSMATIVLFRALSGATAAAMIPMAMAWIGDNIEYARRQAILARFLTGQILGFAGGQLLGGLFADTLGWRWAFGSLLVVYLVVGSLLRRELLRNPELDRHARPASSHVMAQILDVLHEPWARLVIAIVFLEGVVLFGVLAFVPSDLHLRFGIPLTGAGAILGTYGFGGLLYALTARALVPRLGEKGLTAIGGLLLFVALTSLVFAPAWPWAVPGCIAIGLGYYMLHNTLQINATQMAPAARGTAVSVFASAFFLGQSMGVSGAAFAVDRWSVTGLYGLCGPLLLLLGALFSLALRRRAARLLKSRSG